MADKRITAVSIGVLGDAIGSLKLPLIFVGQHRRLDRDRQYVDLAGEGALKTIEAAFSISGSSLCHCEVSHIPKRQLRPSRTMFSFSVFRAPAPTHMYSTFVLKFGVMPYSMPAPAAKPR